MRFWTCLKFPDTHGAFAESEITFGRVSERAYCPKCWADKQDGFMIPATDAEVAASKKRKMHAL